MVELPLITKPMTDSELYEATRKELAFFMEETVRIQGELTAANAEIERLRAQIIELDADYAEASLPDERDV